LLFYVPKIINIGGRITMLQSVENGVFFIRHYKMQQIWTSLFLEVVRQHILDVVENVIHRFVGNLTGFPAVKEFKKLVKIW